MRKLLLFISILPIFVSCKEKKIIYIASYTQECEGEGAQTCMLVKENHTDEWELFYDQIDGFNYEKGYEYQLEVTVTSVENPMEDASSLNYSLSKIISKEKKASISKNTALNTSKIQDDTLNIEYQALSRGMFLSVKVSKNTVEKSNDRNLKNIESTICSEKDWNTILSLLETVTIQKISELKAPTDKRLFDGAPHAELKITYQDQKFTSNSFDHGSPPEEIKLLVNYILSLAESIERQ